MMYFCKFVYCTSESGLYFIQKFDLLRKGDQHKTYVEYSAEVFCGLIKTLELDPIIVGEEAAIVSRTPLHDILSFQQYSRPFSFASHMDHLDSITNSNQITLVSQPKF